MVIRLRELLHELLVVIEPKLQRCRYVIYPIQSISGFSPTVKIG